MKDVDKMSCRELRQEVKTLRSQGVRLRFLLDEAMGWNWMDDDLEDSIEPEILAEMKSAVSGAMN